MKRLIDLTLAVLSLLLLTPIFFILIITIRLGIGSPVFFRQIRPGRDGKAFLMIKFRTMNDEVGGDGKLLPDEHRLNKVGSLLRSTSLDELPELWNVVKGDMSLVGPRPLLMEYLPLYNKDQARRHEVRPGITGWAQINGRNAISWQEKFEFDIWYIENQSLLLDLRILLITCARVLKREGIQTQDRSVMPKFSGNNGDCV